MVTSYNQDTSIIVLCLLIEACCASKGAMIILIKLRVPYYRINSIEVFKSSPGILIFFYSYSYNKKGLQTSSVHRINEAQLG